MLVSWSQPGARRCVPVSPSTAVEANTGKFALQQSVLCAFALREQRECLARDVGLEVRALLVRLEGGLVAEQLVEQELRRIVLGARDQEQLCARLALRLGQEARQDVGNAVGFAIPGLPLRDDEKTAA